MFTYAKDVNRKTYKLAVNFYVQELPQSWFDVRIHWIMHNYVKARLFIDRKDL